MFNKWKVRQKKLHVPDKLMRICLLGGVQVGEAGEAERRWRRHGGGVAAVVVDAAVVAAATEAGCRAGHFSGVRGLLGLHVH